MTRPGFIRRTIGGLGRVLLHAVQSTETMDTRSDRGWLVDWAQGGSAAGVVVNPTTAISVPALLAALRNTAEDFAALPVEPRKNRATRGSDSARSHPSYRLLHLRPNRLQGPFDYRRVMQFNAWLYGHAYARVVRTMRGEPFELLPIHPLRVRPPEEGRTTAYQVYGPQGQIDAVAIEDMIDVRIMGGMGLVGLAREAIGVGLAAQRFGAAYFAEGMSPRVVASIPNKLSPEGRKGLRRRIQGDKENDPVGSRELPVLEGDVRLFTVGVEPAKGQYLETRKFSVEDIARLTRIPLAKLQADIRAKGWSTLELENSDYAMDCLWPLALAWNQEEERVLLTPEEIEAGYYVHTALQARMRGDYTSRTSGYQRAIASGWMSPNDARELEDMNPIEDPAGDLYYIQGAMVPLQVAAAKVEADEGETEEEPEPSPVPEEMPRVPEEGDDEEERELDESESVAGRVAHLWPVYVDVARRAVRREANAYSRAASRHAGNRARFDEWAADFYPLHSEYVRQAFAPVMGATAAACGAGAHDAGTFEVAWTFEARPPSGDVDESNATETLARAAFDWATRALEVVR